MRMLRTSSRRGKQNTPRLTSIYVDRLFGGAGVVEARASRPPSTTHTFADAEYGQPLPSTR
ncbi:MAG: hypothetical protein M3494_13185 [Actinomycetota bacterium]|nr:hypothetical protein [Rubrobacter sp.]MDQ3508947.1 hypothetical protein [Actinomycetota bacterium]